MLNNRQSGRRRGRGGQRPQGNGGRDNGNRIDNRARGNAPQLLEKYKTLARDAQLQGDRVLTEYYLQFADHYFRVVAESRARFEENKRQRDDWPQDDMDGADGDDRMEQADGQDDDGEEQAERSRDRKPPRRRDARRDEERGQGDRDDDNRGNGRGRDYVNGNHDEDQTAPTLDIAILPPALGASVSVDRDEDGDEDAEPAPRRRGRPRRPAGESEAAIDG